MREVGDGPLTGAQSGAAQPGADQSIADPSDTARFDGARFDGARHGGSWRRRTRRGLGVFATYLLGPLVLCALIVGLRYRLDKVSLGPGATLDLVSRTEVVGRDDHPSKGSILLAAVRVRRGLTPAEAFVAWLDNDLDVYDEELLYGDESPKESQSRNREAMDDSKLVASVVAARRLGLTPKGEGVRVVRTFKDLPAEKVLVPGDVLLEIDGRPLCLRGDASAALAGTRPGARVDLLVRHTSKRVETISVVLAKDAASGRALLGVGMETVGCTPPFESDIDTDAIGGPSAGLAMTLALLDRLSAGELTGGVRVATTGTIQADGSVGPVGGVKQKTIAVRSAGAKLFLVPADEYEQARAHAGKMKIAPVRDLDDALAALAALPGSEPLPPSS